MERILENERGQNDWQTAIETIDSSPPPVSQVGDLWIKSLKLRSPDAILYLKKNVAHNKKLILWIINHNILYTHAMHYSFSKTCRLSIYYVKLPV